VRVFEIFDSLQGEGVWTGVPMTFVRLAGCNGPLWGLSCSLWCDTRDSWDPAAGADLQVERVAERVTMPRVCLTGGEPMLQGAEVAELAVLLRRRGVLMHLETNGILPLPPGPDLDWVTVSPKPPEYRVAPGFAGRVDELKVVVDGGFRAEVAEALAAAHPAAVMCLQPEAGGGAEAVASAVAAVCAHPTWRLSVQLHKVLGLP
jgi:Organic radical activating enzymes